MLKIGTKKTLIQKHKNVRYFGKVIFAEKSKNVLFLKVVVIYYQIQKQKNDLYFGKIIFAEKSVNFLFLKLMVTYHQNQK